MGVFHRAFMRTPGQGVASQELLEHDPKHARRGSAP